MGFDGSEALAAVRDARHAVRASLRCVTQLLNLTAIALIVRTRDETEGRDSHVESTEMNILMLLVITELITPIIESRRPLRFALSSHPLLLAVASLGRGLSAPVAKLEAR